MKKILIITNKFPISSKMPGNPRLYEIMKILAQNNELHLIVISKKNEKFDLINPLYEVFKSIVVYNFYFKKEGVLSKICRYILGTPGDKPGIKNYFDLASIKEKIDKAACLLKPDCVYIDGLTPSYFVSNSIIKMSHVDLCDAVSKLKYRESLKVFNFRKKIALLYEAFSVYIRELVAICYSKTTSFISQDEICLYPNIFKNKIHVLPQGVSHDEFYYQPLKNNSLDLIFFGALDYVPNNDAAIWFTKVVYPDVLEKFPECKLKIVGKSPTQEVLSLASNNVEISPNVPSMIEHIHSSGIVIVPLRIGAGVKNKILVAALSGRPIIASSLALEGLPSEVTDRIFKADSLREYLDQLSYLRKIDVSELNASLLELSNYIKKEFSWLKSASLLERVFGDS